jgi:8-oxo-dGTP diphosphatase
MFNVRVYGVLLGPNKEVLVADEYIRGGYYTKFPGGGLEFGEGTRDCLKREFKEEMDLEIKVGDHLYTTDFFQLSAFRPTEYQIIAIYYWVTALEPIKAPLRRKPFDFDEREMKMYAEREETETFRFIAIDAFNEDCVTLPIDKVVARIVTDRHHG